MSETPYEIDRLGALPHPRETQELLGHAQAEQAMLRAFLSGQLHHAWLIGGPRGIGKATLAYRFARFLLKYRTPAQALAAEVHSLHVPPEDPVFRRIAAQGHSDLIALRRPWDQQTRKFKTVITVDEVRRVASLYSKKAGEGGWRICIVDPAEEMNANAANALLKILEEPPSNSLFLLIANMPGRLLPTIRSRCRMLTLQPLGESDTGAILARHMKELTPDEMAATARLAQGSAGRALELALEGGLDLYRDMRHLLSSLPRLDMAAVHALADRLTARNAGQEYAIFAELLSDWLTRLIRAGAGHEADMEVLEGEGALMRRLAEAQPLDRWVEVWEKITHSIARAEQVNLDRRQVILNAFSMLENAAHGAYV